MPPLFTGKIELSFKKTGFFSNIFTVMEMFEID